MNPSNRSSLLPEEALNSTIAGLRADINELKAKQFTSNKGGIVYYTTQSGSAYDALVAAPSSGGVVPLSGIDIQAVFTSDIQKHPFIEFTPIIWKNSMTDPNKLTEPGFSENVYSYMSTDKQLGWHYRYIIDSAVTVNFYVKAVFYGTDNGTFTLNVTSIY